MQFVVRVLTMASALIAALALSACGGGAPISAASAPPPAPAFSQQAYELGGGDQLRIIVFGEPDLSGEFVVDGAGYVSLPLVGEVQAGGLNLRQFEQQVVAALSEGYLRDPRVSVEVLNFRPFYIIGEVENGGEYPYAQGMTVLNAVAVAGGYTYRADRRRVFITRAQTNEELQYSLDQAITVLPGDVIRIPERFF